MAVLAAFMPPIVAGHGRGHRLPDHHTLVVRGIALGEISRRDWTEVVLKELSFGAIYGILAGSLSAGLAYALTHNTAMAGIVFIAMAGTSSWRPGRRDANLALLGQDPALASTVWLTTITDWIGFFLLLGLGTILIERTGSAFEIS